MAQMGAAREVYPVPLWDDSGCVQIQCSGYCRQYGDEYICFTRAVYERYDENGSPKPIRVGAHARCDVIVSIFTHIIVMPCEDWNENIGAGRVTASASCSIQAPLWPARKCIRYTGGDACWCSEL